MKVVAIPAQITTIEDRIVGNLNPTQLLLLTLPLFVTVAIFFILPPLGHYALYKILIAVPLFSICSLLSLRIGDKIALDLLRLRLGYELRPHIYTYQRNQTSPELPFATINSLPKEVDKIAKPLAIKTTSKDRLRGKELLSSSRCLVSFQIRAGGLIVKVSNAG